MKKLALLALAAVAAGCGSGVTGTTGAVACNTAAACGMIFAANVVGISACTDFVEQINDPAKADFVRISADQVNCIAQARANCDGARRCLNNGNEPSPCSGSSSSCDGKSLVTCDGVTGTNNSNGTRSYGCSGSQSCQANNNIVACGYGTCAIGLPTCADENTVQSCFTGILQKEDCSREDGKCTPGNLRGAHCRGNGAGCSGTDNLACEGSVLVSCLDGQEARRDCARDNLRCVNKHGGGGFDCALGDDCDSGSFPASCNGKTLRFCNNGKETTLSCADYGFNGCTPNMGGHCTKE
jgi:hypothetical protein